MSQLIREKCGETPSENKIILFFKAPGKTGVSIPEWAKALRNAVPSTDEEKQMVDDLKMGLAKAGGAPEIGVLAWQALAVVNMAERPADDVPVAPAAE